MSIKIKYLDIPDKGRQCTAEGRGQSFSDPGSVLTELPQAAYGTLENRGWPLDGSRTVLPDQPGSMWWSETASDENGIFSAPPVLTLKLPEPCTATGISFRFSPETEDYCALVRITWLRETVVLAQRECVPEGAVWALCQTVEDFDTVRIELLKTHRPYSFAKVGRITVGLIHWFYGDELTSAQLTGDSDHLLSELTVDTMSVKLRDKKNRELRPQENQKLELYRDDRLLATQYITSSTREEGDSYHLSCQGTLGLLEDDFLGGIYENAPMETVLKEILGGIDYEIAPIFEGKTVSGYLPVCTRRQALQQLAFATGAAVSTAEDGRVCLRCPQTAVSHTFRKNEIFRGSSVETQTRVTRVEVAAHSFCVSEEREELLREERLDGEDILFTFQNPHHSYAITGGTITESGANYVRITAQGEVTLTAGKYLQTTALYTKDDPVRRSAEQGSVLSVTDATLVGRNNAQEVLMRLWNGAALRQKLSFDGVVTDQYPGQVVAAADPWGGLVQGYLTSMEWEFTQNGQTAHMTVFGNQVPAQIAMFYAGELYAGEEVAHLCS